MSDSIQVLRVVGWDLRYETRGTLKKDGPRESVPALTDLGRVEMQRLLDAPGGYLALSMWHVVWALAARSQRRGALVNGGVPLSVPELARVARCPETVAEQALILLCSPGIALLERVSLDEALRPPVIPPAPPRKPRKPPPPPPPLAECPFCHADLTDLFVVPPLGGSATSSDAPPEGGTTNARRPAVVLGPAGASPSHLCESHEDGQDCPSCLDDAANDHPDLGVDVPCVDDYSELERQFNSLPLVRESLVHVRSRELDSIRELIRQFESGEVTPEAAERFVMTHHASLVERSGSPQSAEQQVKMREVVPQPPASQRNVETLSRRKQKRKAKNLARRQVSAK